MNDDLPIPPVAGSARELAAAVRRGQVSAVELCDAAIARIEARDGAINAIVVRDFERAREQARERDAARRQGADGALFGVPMTVKESYNIAGLPTHWGLPPFRDHRPSEDALLVQRLKAAGAVILGKSNVPPALADWQTGNAIHGRTVNPHDPARTPGGSSGGGAAAVAAGMVALELGSDIGGSIRIPAHCCGVFGHKPSYGLLPMRGHAFPGSDGAPPELAVGGPLAHSAGDLALALGVLAGPDVDEAAGYRLALQPPRRPGLADCRILVLAEHPCALADAEMRGALDRLGLALQGAGAEVVDHSPLLPDLAALHRTYVSLLMTIVSRGAPGQGTSIPAHQWLDLLDQRARCRRQLRGLFEVFDVIVAPPFGCAAFPHSDEPDWGQRSLIIDGQSTPFGAQLAWSGLATLAGLPATVAPMARAASGLPLGVQIIGPYLGDRTTIAVAGQIEALRLV